MKISSISAVVSGELRAMAFFITSVLLRRPFKDCIDAVSYTHLGNPLAMAAGLANLEELEASGAYGKLEKLSEQLAAGMKDAAKSASVPVQVNACGSMFCTYFTGTPVHNVADAMKSDRERFKRYFHGMLAEGIYFAPSQFEAGFLSTTHTEADIAHTVDCLLYTSRCV